MFNKLKAVRALHRLGNYQLLLACVKNIPKLYFFDPAPPINLVPVGMCPGFAYVGELLRGSLHRCFP
jgi:hypothetical protein